MRNLTVTTYNYFHLLESYKVQIIPRQTIALNHDSRGIISGISDHILLKRAPFSESSAAVSTFNDEKATRF